MIPQLSGYDLPLSSEIPTNKVNWIADPSRAALLIHDMQDYFLDFWGTESDFVKRLVENIRVLKQFCKAQGIPVFYTAQPGKQSPQERGLLTDVWGEGIVNRPERKDIVAELTPTKEDKQLVKHRYSAFQKSDFREQLRAGGRDQLIICGVYAHIGCLVTATEAFMMDIKTFMVADALADFSRAQHMTALQTAAECCSSVVTLKDLTTHLIEHDLRQVILQALDDDEEEWPEADENLIDYGVNSVQIMNLAARWRHVYPDIDFVKLGQNPTLSSWRGLLINA